MRTLHHLLFDNPNNAALSLTMLAELVRRGEVVILKPPVLIEGDEKDFLTIDFEKRH